jgi:hypothetical protein
MIDAVGEFRWGPWNGIFAIFEAGSVQFGNRLGTPYDFANNIMITGGSYG